MYCWGQITIDQEVVRRPASSQAHDCTVQYFQWDQLCPVHLVGLVGQENCVPGWSMKGLSVISCTLLSEEATCLPLQCALLSFLVTAHHLSSLHNHQNCDRYMSYNIPRIVHSPHGHSSQWTFVSRTMSGIQYLLHVVPLAIHEYLVPALTGRPGFL